MPELLEWSLLRITARAGFAGICAAGIRSNPPDEESRMVVTSRVLRVSPDRRRMLTEHSEYDLLRELHEPPEGHRRHHLWLLYLKTGRQAVPERVEWLRPDESVFAVAAHAEIEAIIAQEEKARLPDTVERRRWALNQAQAHTRIDGLPDAPSEALDDYVEGKISGAEAERRILQRYKKD